MGILQPASEMPKPVCVFVYRPFPLCAFAALNHGDHIFILPARCNGGTLRRGVTHPFFGKCQEMSHRDYRLKTNQSRIVAAWIGGNSNTMLSLGP